MIIGVGFHFPGRTERAQIVRLRRRKHARSRECVAANIDSGMFRNLPKQQDVLLMSHATAIELEAPLVASPDQAMKAIQVSRKKLYELINAGELERYTEGKSRRITIKSTNEYIERLLAAEAARPTRAATNRNDYLLPRQCRQLHAPIHFNAEEGSTAVIRTCFTAKAAGFRNSPAVVPPSLLHD
jgi:hypothetical protein